MKKAILFIIFGAVFLGVVYVNVQSACHKVIGIYSKIDFGSSQVQDMINYDRIWKDKMLRSDLNFDDLKKVEAYRMDREMKVLENLLKIMNQVDRVSGRS